jgi:Mrp family chromosome partitioning ATPase/capsular polysaccharide biosynthesis protein
MPSPGPKEPRETDWMTPHDEQHTLQRYVTTIRERAWLIVLCTVLAAGAALLYVSTAERVYTATADLLVTPVPGGDDTTLGLGLIRDSNDPTRDVSTASRYVQSVPVAERVRRELGRSESANQLLGDISAEPLAQSSLVAVTAEAGTAEEAAELANAFATATVRERTAQLRAQLDMTIPALRSRLRQLPAEEREADSGLTARLAGLEALRGVPDPTVRVATPATPPDRQSAPRPLLSLAAGILGGLLLGVGAAFGMQAIDPRLRREEQLRELYRLPILSRIPTEPREKRGSAIAPESLSGATFEAYRTLRASLAATRETEFRTGSVLVTGSSPGEGKTTTAINLAHSLVLAGNKVILIEADVHRPQIASALGVRARQGLGAVLIRQVALEDALVTVDRYGPDLQFLLVDRPGSATADRLSLPTARQLVAEAEELADYVVIDSPPLTEVIDALPLAQEVSHVLLVARLGRTKLPKLTELGEILGQNGIRPAGVALIGVERSRAGYYYTGSAVAAGEREPALPAA